MFRLAVIGDLQYNDEDCDTLKIIAQDINSLSPDAVILLGDYGKGCDLGTGKGMAVFSQVLKTVNCETVVPMIGNHDLQLETGKNKYSHGTTARIYESCFGFKPKNRILEFENFRIMIVNVDNQPENSCYTVNECYVDEQSFSELKNNIEKRKGVPIIICTHAPFLGAGLITVPEVHVRATNAFLDQNHEVYRWDALNKEYPEIVMWFSAHYHMGHSYANSISNSNGTHCFITGVATSAARDNMRHSRVVDISDDKTVVRTFCHTTHRLYPTADFEHKGSLAGLINKKIKILSEKPDNNKTGLIKSFETGCGNVVKNGLKIGKNNKLYSLTDCGYLWEIDLNYGEALGTLHFSKTAIQGFETSDDYVWKICNDKMLGHKYDDIRRFMRKYDDPECKFIVSEKIGFCDRQDEMLYDIIIENGMLIIRKRASGKEFNYSSQHGAVSAACIYKQQENSCTVVFSLNTNKSHTLYEIIQAEF